MKFTKIIIPLLTASIIFSGCSVPEITESSEEETFTSDKSSEQETSSGNYFLENNVEYSKLDIPKIDFERDFYTQIDNNFIDSASEDYLNFSFVDENDNCYIQLHNNLLSYNSIGKQTGKYDFQFGCYKINSTLYTWRQDSADVPDLFSIYAININDGVKRRLYYNTTKPVFCKDTLYFKSDFDNYDEVLSGKATSYYVANGSLKAQKLVSSDLDGDCYLTPLDSSYEEKNLTVIGDYLYTWHKNGNYISQLNTKTNETKNCKSPFQLNAAGEPYGISYFNFTDSYFFYKENNKIIRTDLEFNNRKEIDINLELNNVDLAINICRNRIFIAVNLFSMDRYILEIDASGNILKTFKND